MTKQNHQQNANFRHCKPYHHIAEFYDNMMDHVYYREWAHYIYNLIANLHLPEGKIIEIGCGTGTFSSYFPIPLSGVDKNLSMLELYRKKNFDSNLICDALPSLSSLKSSSFIGMLILYDTVNYMLTQEEWQLFFDRAWDILTENGWMIFDVVTPYCCIQYFDKEIFREKYQNASVIRKTSFDVAKSIQHNYFYIYTDEGNFYEHHRQFIPSIDWIKKLLTEKPFSVIAAYDDLTDRPAGTNSLRVHFVLRKK